MTVLKMSSPADAEWNVGVKAIDGTRTHAAFRGRKPARLRQAVLLDVVGGPGGEGEVLGVRRHRADGLLVVRQRGQGLPLAQVPHLHRLVVAARDDLRQRRRSS